MQDVSKRQNAVYISGIRSGALSIAISIIDNYLKSIEGCDYSAEVALNAVRAEITEKFEEILKEGKGS